MISQSQSYSSITDVMQTPLITPPGAGSLWEGVSHRFMLQTFQKEFALRKMRMAYINTDLSRDGADLAAGWQIEEYENYIRGYNAGFALVTSNARRCALRFYSGLVEEETQIPLVTDLIEGWRFIKGVCVETEVKRIVDKFVSNIEWSGILLDKFKKQKLNKETVALLLMSAGRKKIISWSQIGKIDHKWSKTNLCSWGLIRAFWQSTKECPAQDQMGKCLLFTRLVVGGVKELVKEEVL